MYVHHIKIIIFLFIFWFALFDIWQKNQLNIRLMNAVKLILNWNTQNNSIIKKFRSCGMAKRQFISNQILYFKNMTSPVIFTHWLMIYLGESVSNWPIFSRLSSFLSYLVFFYMQCLYWTRLVCVIFFSNKYKTTVWNYDYFLYINERFLIFFFFLRIMFCFV